MLLNKNMLLKMLFQADKFIANKIARSLNTRVDQKRHAVSCRPLCLHLDLK